jgi:hypothetical protein
VPALRSVKISSRYNWAASSLISGSCC